MSWTVGEITIRGSAAPAAVAGWVWKSFGLDFRPVWPIGTTFPWGVGWCVTHLPSGFGMGGLIMGLEEAKAVCAEIDEWADWSLVQPHTAKFLGPKMRDLKARLGLHWCPFADMSPPWIRYGVESLPVELVS